MSGVPPGFNISDFAGPQLVGQLMNWGLMGMLSVQVYLYHTFFPEDPLALRAFVFGVFVFEWVQTGLVTLYSFDAFVSNFGNVANLLEFHSSWFSVPVMSGLISMAVQLFYARRIWILSRSRILGGIISVLALAQCSAAIVTGVDFFQIKFAENAARSKPTVIAWLSISASVDVIIATAMTYLLLQTKTGLRPSDKIVNKLVRLVIESGTVTASVAIVEVVLFTASPNTLYYQCPAIVLAKLYANTMITSLNNRAFIQRTRMNVSTVSMQSESAFRSPFGRTRDDDDAAAAAETIIHVNVLKETEVDLANSLDYPMRGYPQKGHSVDRIA